MLVSMKNICKDYALGKSSVPVLRNISLNIEEGDFLAIMGPSGSGKTTLMNLIGCLDTPTSGEYSLDGETVTKLSEGRLSEIRNKKIGFVFQNFYLLPRLTAIENVCLPMVYAGVPKKERIERAKEALKTVGLEDRMNFKPNPLSGGQSQRVAIARAISMKPKLVLADEPTGALDSVSGAQVMELFKQLNDAGTTVLVITHEQAVADCMKKTYHIFDGQIRETEEQS